MNERMTCPICKSHIPMKFIWPSPQDDPAVEAVIGRFQECRICYRWQGDVLTGQQYLIMRSHDGLSIDGKHYAKVGDWLRSIGLIDERK